MKRFLKVKPLLGEMIHHDTEFGKNVRIGFGVVIEKGCKVGDGTFIGHYCVLRKGTAIGDNCKIGHYVLFEGNCRVGNRVSVHPYSVITIGAMIEDCVFIGDHFLGLNDKRMSYLRWDWKPCPYKIRRGARIGCAVTVLPGIEIGENSFVGAGSVVTKDVPERAIVFGNPAKVRGAVSEEDCLKK